MKLFMAVMLVAGLFFLCSTSWAQTDSTENMGTEAMTSPGFPSSGFSYGSPAARPSTRSGAARLGEWVCRDEPPPPGHVITRGGSMGSCAGTCASRYIEPLRDHMVICAGQQVPEGYDLLGVTTVADCDCVADTENGLIIQLKPGYSIQSQGVVRNWSPSQSAQSADTGDE